MVGYYERKLTSMLGRLHGLSVLEIGCGMGFCLSALERLGVSTIAGIDANAEQIASACKRSAFASYLAVEQFPEYVASHQSMFDCVMMFDVLEHIPNEERLRFLRRVWIMLKPGGKLICQVPNANSLVASRYRYIDATHYTIFTPESLDFELYRSGFDEINIQEADPIQRPWWRHSRELLRWIIHSSIRRLTRLCYEFELGTRDTTNMPLTPNIVAIAIRGFE
jgi:2-polyprenyl-3-methyl-5-hydroxy-6-metoxy-1,4-benzoquinol methylase